MFLVCIVCAQWHVIVIIIVMEVILTGEAKLPLSLRSHIPKTVNDLDSCQIPLVVNLQYEFILSLGLLL